jgi:hypothetical protein
MKLESHFSIGDKVWVYRDEPTEATVGQIQMTYMQRKRKTPELEERYMTHEFGIGSGSYFIYGKSIYATREECVEGNQEAIAEKALQDEANRIQQRTWLLQEIAEAQAKLSKLETTK